MRLFRDRVFASAAIVSLLTGYAFATAIIGGAVFVDRVLYGGPADQQAALGSLAGATAIGALASGFIVRVVSLRLRHRRSASSWAALALVAMSAWTPIDLAGHGRPGDGGLRARLRADRHRPLDGGGRAGRRGGLRRRLGDRDRGPDDRDGDRAGRPDGLWLDHDRPPPRPDLQHAGRLPPVHPDRAPGSRPARSARRRRARDVGVGRGGPDHGRPVPRRGGARRWSRSCPAWPSGTSLTGRRSGVASDAPQQGLPDPS